jgi:hypothetical protein
VTVSDESGWEFDTLKRIYTNVGLGKNRETTLVAWKIAQLSPASTALKPEETREEKLIFAVAPQDGKRFTVRATLRYFFAPSSQGGFGDQAAAAKMAEKILTVPGKRRS